ncbi:MAG: ABC transporter ATP-binding protein [bacterium]
MNAAICAKGLTKTYGVGHAKVIAISEINLAVQPGEFVAIMGPSGSGKTTLLSCLGCIIEPTEGQIFIDGLNIYNHQRQVALSKIRREKIGFIFQSFNLIPFLSAMENVEIIINTKEKKKPAMQLLDRLGLKNKYNRKPSELSGGEKQRVSIARALANNPKVILADEPTANLDTEHGHEVIQIFKELSQDNCKAIIMVTHDIRMADNTHRTIQMVDGKIIEDV